MTDFVHLHLHTEYSLLDGAVRLIQPVVDKDNPNKAKKLHPLSEALKAMGMDAVAITDHGNMYGAYTFVQTLREDGIKPIVGQEFYVAEDLYVKTPEVLKQRYHLILLAKNLKGYENLMKLSSKAFVDGFYMRPRIDLEHIAEHSEGLICLSACLAGKIPRLILAGKYEEAKQYAIRMRDMFDEGDFYIELQDHHLPEDAIVNNQLVKIAREIGVKVVATNDVHYLKREDADMQDTMMCITLGCKKSDDKTNSARFSNDEFYLKSGDEMAELFDWCPEAISATREIADKIEDFFVLKRKPIIPVYRNEEMGDRDEKQYLHDIAWEGLRKRYDEITPDMKERIDYELGIINKCGFDGYFLIVWDYVNAAKKMGIPVGPGRGSGCGSIVAYSIGITDIDPLKYQLLFERFLSQERVTMPDFDVDFCFVRRQEVIDYCIRKYGKDNVSQIIAYSTMSAKAVVKDVARVLDVPYAEAALWVKEIPVGKVLLQQVLMEGSSFFSPDFKRIYDSSPAARQAIDLAMQLEGMPRQTSMHAAGVVICRDPVENYCALSRNGSGSDSVITTQFDKNIIEDVGLLKMDFLGLKTLTDINEALKLIKKDKGVELDFDKLGYEDPKVYELISSGDCEAVFQLESGGMKRFMARLQPDSLEDVIAGISLYRPGPMQFVDDFIEGKKHPDQVQYAHPILKEVLGNTYGCIVYQEQVMQIAQKMAGFSFGGADIMRRAMSKKKADVLLSMRDVFLHGGVLKGDATQKQNCGAVANGVDEEIANHLFDQIMKFAEYAFNKSHAAAYTFLTYQTAYLKCYYPTHFIVAVVNNRITNADEVKHYMNYLKRTGVKILQPDINRSEKLFSIDGENVRYGLSGIKNVGEAATEFIIAERNAGGEFKDLRDLLERCSEQINKRMLESLIKGGALDCFNLTRSTLMASYERIMDDVVKSKKNRMSAQMSLFDEMVEYKDTYSVLEEYPKLQRLSLEKEVLGMYLSGHPLDDYREAAGEFNFDTGMLFTEQADEDGNVNMVIDQQLSGKSVRFGCIVASYEVKTTKQQQKFAVGRLEDRAGSIAFTMYARTYEKYAELLAGDKPIKVTGKIDLRDESEPKINIDGAELWNNNAAAQAVSKPARSEAEGILYVLVNSADERGTVAEVLKMYEGNTPCQAQITYDGKPRLMEYPQTVRICDELLARLGDLLGSNRVRYVRKK
ncbi:MAG: DNA polymerase III subunit alpha [Clostridia bacterium]|jgi:DNA polymerase-3 subunit alpha|nr:DNA polymerase III subunit alpha [Clostridia bacterium]